MLSLTNRDYQSILEDLKNEVLRLTDDWTDFNDSDIGVVWLKTLAGLSSMLNYYIDKQANENYISLAKESKNIESILEILGYRKPLRTCAKSTVHLNIFLAESQEYRLHNDIIIPKHTRFFGQDKKLTAITAEGVIITPETSEISIPLFLANPVSKTYSNVYLSTYKFYLPKGNIVEDEFHFTVDGVEWERVDNAFLEIDGGPKYSLHRDAYNSVYILLTHDYINYVSTNGIFTLDYLEADVIEAPNLDLIGFDFTPTTVDGVPYPDIITVKRTEPFVGGFDVTDTLLERAKAQKAAKVLNRVVTLEDYLNFVLTIPGVQDCEVSDMSVKNTSNPKPYEVDIFVLPQPIDGVYYSMSKHFKELIEQKLSQVAIYGCTYYIKDADIVYKDIDIKYYVRDKRNVSVTLSNEISDLVRSYYSNLRFNKPILNEEIITLIMTRYPQISMVTVETEPFYPKIGQCAQLQLITVKGEEYSGRL